MRYDMVWGHHASSSSRGSLWISGAFPGTPVQYTGGPIFLLGCLSLPLAVGGSHGMGREGGAGGILGLRSPKGFRPVSDPIWVVRDTYYIFFSTLGFPGYVEGSGDVFD